MAAQGYLRHVACAGFIHDPQVPRPYLSYATPDEDLRLSSGLDPEPLFKSFCHRDSHRDVGVLPPHLGHLGPHTLTRRIAVPRAGSCLEWTARRSNQIFPSRRFAPQDPSIAPRRQIVSPRAALNPWLKCTLNLANFSSRRFAPPRLIGLGLLGLARRHDISTPRERGHASSGQRAGQIIFSVSALRAAGPLHRSEMTDRLPVRGAIAQAHHFDAPLGSTHFFSCRRFAPHPHSPETMYRRPASGGINTAAAC
ncbi:hypothetical protein B0H15DRAFT_945806 [Mycena belliarum]|uniref:Uncharacterized protein n=1 Tax=Mycena belliarum TaxID=1033014 RepID=A0AAD6UD76_9AGAR|nr:hypothetical protein B0H15DRAFT_945806 [Mycena belliae]